jgi:hypothetical protein
MLKSVGDLLKYIEYNAKNHLIEEYVTAPFSTTNNPLHDTG